MSLIEVKLKNILFKVGLIRENIIAMNIKNLLLCLAILLFCQCTEKKIEVNVYDEFSQVQSVSAVKKEVPSVLLYPRSLYLLKDKLVALNEGTDTLFQVFEKSDLAYQGQFGTKGNGPGEFHLPSLQAVSQTDDSFVLNDLKTLKTMTWKEGKLCITSADLPFDFQYFNGLTKLEEGKYGCLAGHDADHELRILNEDGTHVDFGEFPEAVEPRFKDALARNQAYTRLAVAKPDGSRMALFYQYLRRYRIYKADQTLETDNILTLLPSQEKPDVEDEVRYIHPIALYATDNYIYTLNLDMKAEEMGSKMPNIQVFDWEGRPLKMYQLDCYISSFVVDEGKKVIYGVFVEDDNHIYQFNL